MKPCYVKVNIPLIFRLWSCINLKCSPAVFCVQVQTHKKGGRHPHSEIRYIETTSIRDVLFYVNLRETRSQKQCFLFPSSLFFYVLAFAPFEFHIFLCFLLFKYSGVHFPSYLFPSFKPLSLSPLILLNYPLIASCFRRL